MLHYHRLNCNSIIAELLNKNFLILNTQDVLDLLGDIGTNGCDRLIIHKCNLTNDFFDLKTGLAGEILQKFSNYFVKLAIVGDFSDYTSSSLRDFIGECNRGCAVNFVPDLETALSQLNR